STTAAQGGARFVLDQVAALEERHDDLEIHLAGHSAGSIFFAPFVQRLTGRGAGGRGQTVASCTLWAPAATVDLFKACYVAAIRSGAIERFALFTLDENHDR